MAATPSAGTKRGRSAAEEVGALSSTAAAVSSSAAAAAAAEDESLLLLTVLAGNPVTSAAILSCLNSVDASTLRQVHPAVAGVVVAVPWADMDTPVADAVRWRTALPAAVGGRVARLAQRGAPMAPLGAALAGVVDLDLRDCPPGVVQLPVRALLPRSLRVLRVAGCQGSCDDFHVEHLTSLEVLECSMTFLNTGGLPPSLRELRIMNCDHPVAGFRHLSALRLLLYKRNVFWSQEVELDAGSIASLQPSLQELNLPGLRPWPAGVSLAHLVQLRVFRAVDSDIDDTTLASLPPCLQELDVADCDVLTGTVSFVHLPALQSLTVKRCTISDTALASLPPGLVYLEAFRCHGLTPAAVLPHLPSLRVLGVSYTGIGDALVASLPAGLRELRMLDCSNVTASATLDHVRALQALHIHTTDLAPAVVAACRARGCTVSAVQVLRRHGSGVQTLALLPDGRVASSDTTNNVRLWDPAQVGEEPVSLTASMRPTALVALPDGRLAVGTTHNSGWVNTGGVEVWDAACVPPMRHAIIEFSRGVDKLELLPDGFLAAGCSDRIVRVDVDAGAVTAVLEGFRNGLQALAALPDGSLASCAYNDKVVWLWDVDAQVCVAQLAGHTDAVRCLAALPDGRLASGSSDRTVRLWDVGARACVGVLAGHADSVSAVAALPDGRLMAAAGLPVERDDGDGDSVMWLWDTRPGAAAVSSHPAGSAVGVVLAYLPATSGTVRAMEPRPDGCLACLPRVGNAVPLLTVPPAPALAPLDE